MAKRFPITDLPRALIEGGFEATTYHRVYNRVIAGTIPARRANNGRWTFDLEDLHQIAEALGLSEAHAA